MSDYFTSPPDVAAVTKALSANINDLDAAVVVAFDKLPTENNLKRGTVNYAVDTGVVNAYLIDLPHVPSGYVDGLLISFRPLNTNTNSATVNVNSLGVKSVRRGDGTALSAGDITVGAPITARYSTATGYFHMSANSSVDAAAAAASASAAATSASSASSSASSASSSASTATTQASTATTQASNAATSATNAASSATTASTQASNAATSATSASSSASTATTQASNAATSATNAATSATNAASSATTASTQASNASTQASNASTSATNAATSATDAAASATLAANSAASFIGTSTTSRLMATGLITLTTQAAKNFITGQFIIAASNAGATNYMFGQVSSYSGTTLIIDVQLVGGSGTYADWNISIEGARGPQGTQGATGPAGNTTGSDIFLSINFGSL